MSMAAPAPQTQICGYPHYTAGHAWKCVMDEHDDDFHYFVAA